MSQLKVIFLAPVLEILLKGSHVSIVRTAFVYCEG